jgi:glycosyltransferase involved in cell wall biosynthesis
MAKPLRVLMVCAHEPSLDPRIRWEADAAAARFSVTVLGFNRADGSKPEVEETGGYRAVRLRHFDCGVSAYLWRLMRLLPKPLLWALAGLAVLLFPVLFVGELIVRLALRLLRALRALIPGPLISLGLLRLFLHRMRRRWRIDRIAAIKYYLRTQFAPAASIFGAYIDDMAEKPNVIHCNDLDTLLVGVLAKRQYGCRLVYDAHEFWPVADSLSAWLDTTFFSLLERLLVRQADAVVTVNPLLAEEIRRAYQLKHVYSVPNVEPWVADRPPLSEKSAMADLAVGRVKFLFQGRFTIARGIEELIRAWVHVDGSKAALFLRGPDNPWRQQAIELATRLGLLGNSVYFLDAVTEDQLVAAAAEADVGLVPYLPLIINERLSCPNKLSQYLHAGLMVVTSDLPYVRSVVDEASAGMHYDSANLSTLVDVVHQIAADPQMLQRYKENARRFAQDHFNWQAHGRIFLELYRGAQDEPPPGARLPREQRLELSAS